MNISKNAITHQKGQQKGQKGKMAIWKMSLPCRALQKKSLQGGEKLLWSFDCESVIGDTEQ